MSDLLDVRIGLRVEVAAGGVQGTVVDGDGDWLQVRWDDGSLTWSQARLLYLVGEWSVDA